MTYVEMHTNFLIKEQQKIIQEQMEQFYKDKEIPIPKTTENLPKEAWSFRGAKKFLSNAKKGGASIIKKPNFGGLLAKQSTEKPTDNAAKDLGSEEVQSQIL